MDAQSKRENEEKFEIYATITQRTAQRVSGSLVSLRVHANTCPSETFFSLLDFL